MIRIIHIPAWRSRAQQDVLRHKKNVGGGEEWKKSITKIGECKNQVWSGLKPPSISMVASRGGSRKFAKKCICC